MKTAFKLRVILLEDRDSIRRLFTDIFVERGYETFAFSTPAICPLQIIPECRCGKNQTCTDVIVSDLNMPNMTGLCFIENQRKKACKCTHVALVSASWTEQDLLKAHELGCKTFTKPFFFKELENWLDVVEKSIDPTRELCSWFQDQSSRASH